VAPGDNTLAAAGQVAGQLDAAATTRLLRAPGVYHGGIDDVLLAALGLALRGWSRDRYGDDPGNPLVALEGHGRETAADLTRSVGWFTSLFPVSLPVGDLDLTDPATPGHAIRRVKEHLRVLPDKGLGFGILRYLDPAATLADPALAAPQVLFNYLGRFDHGTADPKGWRLDDSGLAAAQDDPDRQRLHLIDINAGLDAAGALRFGIGYCTSAHTAEAIADLARRFETALIAFSAHCLDAPLANRHTPSDFPLAGCDQDSLDRIVARYPDLADLVPLTTLQQGLAFERMALPRGPRTPTTSSCCSDSRGRSMRPPWPAPGRR